MFRSLTKCILMTSLCAILFTGCLHHIKPTVENCEEFTYRVAVGDQGPMKNDITGTIIKSHNHLYLLTSFHGLVNTNPETKLFLDEPEQNSAKFNKIVIYLHGNDASENGDSSRFDLYFMSSKPIRQRYFILRDSASLKAYKIAILPLNNFETERPKISLDVDDIQKTGNLTTESRIVVVGRYNSNNQSYTSYDDSMTFERVDTAKRIIWITGKLKKGMTGAPVFVNREDKSSLKLVGIALGTFYDAFGYGHVAVVSSKFLRILLDKADSVENNSESEERIRARTFFYAN